MTSVFEVVCRWADALAEMADAMLMPEHERCERAEEGAPHA